MFTTRSINAAEYTRREMQHFADLIRDYAHASQYAEAERVAEKARRLYPHKEWSVRSSFYR